jgi:multicomponent Na+:H+ antiporter subunit G
VHAASVVDTLGAGLMLLGLLLQAGLTLVGVKLLMIGLLLLVASPTATHALVRAAMHRGLEPLLADPKEDPSSKP